MPHLVDIVIPMYNRAHCVDDLIQELQNQTMQDFCAIIVDDGSTDGTFEVLQQRLKDAPFAYKLIKKENGGAASARNAALRAVTSEWVAFIDSDDRVKPHYLEYLVRAVTEAGADLGVCHYQSIVVEQNTPVCPDEAFSYQVMTPAECMRMYCTQWLGVYCLLIRGDLVHGKNLYFDESCNYCEDAPYIADVIEASSKVAHVNQQLYLYYTYEGSLSRSPQVSKFISGIDSFRRMEVEMACRNTEAARVFEEMGKARYYVAVCRKAAVQMSYEDFCKLVSYVDFRQYKDKLHNLIRSQRMAGAVLLVSKRAFYHAIRLLFRD